MHEDKWNVRMKLVDLKALAQLTSLSVFTIRKFRKLGLPHYRVGRKILVDPQEFEAWLQQFKCGSVQPKNNLEQLVENTLEKY